MAMTSYLCYFRHNISKVDIIFEGKSIIFTFLVYFVPFHLFDFRIKRTYVVCIFHLAEVKLGAFIIFITSSSYIPNIIISCLSLQKMTFWKQAVHVGLNIVVTFVLLLFVQVYSFFTKCMTDASISYDNSVFLFVYLMPQRIIICYLFNRIDFNRNLYFVFEYQSMNVIYRSS